MHINILAVVAAAVAGFVVGGLWYSPLLFVKPWKTELGLDPNVQGKMAAMGPQLAGCFALCLVQAGMFAVFLGKQPPLLGAAYGAAAGLCWVAAALGITYLFEGRGLRLFLINGGYNVVSFTAYGLILSLWR